MSEQTDFAAVAIELNMRLEATPWWRRRERRSLQARLAYAEAMS